MLTLKSSEDEFQRLKYEKENNKSPRVRKRCSSIYMKMIDNRLSINDISRLLGCHRTSVDRWLHSYITNGVSSLLHEDMHRPVSEMEQHKDAIMNSLNESPVHSVNEARQRIEQICGILRSPTQVRNFLVKHGYKYRKMGQVWCQAHSHRYGQCTLPALQACHGESLNVEY